MDYIELTCVVEPAEPFSEIIIARLAELGFDMFDETEDGFKAYIQKDDFPLHYAVAFEDLEAKVKCSEKHIPYTNWNAVWESNFEPVVVDDFVAIRADFHKPIAVVEYELVITPKMSFGTGHHATTAMMIGMMETIDLTGKNIFDFGTGTGVLAILAEKCGHKALYLSGGGVAASSIVATPSEAKQLRDQY